MTAPPQAADLDRRRAAIASAIDGASDDLRALSLAIHAHPELNFEEHHAHGVLTDYLEGAGFAVTPGAYEMPTAFAATAGSGSPTIAVFCEYDALPGIGHACGHNLIAISGVATALALKAALRPGEGTVLVLGSPAEEGGGGKVLMIERGALDGVAAALMLHPAPGSSAWANLIARDEVRIRYRGRNAHAGAAPWQGVNALDALIAAYNAISAMRQQMRPTDRVHGVITKGGDKPNIIPDLTEAEFYIRSRSGEELAELRAKVFGCFEGAATTAGCTLEIETPSPTYLDIATNDVMAERYCENMQMLEVILSPKDAGGIAGASSDMGNVSYAVPSIHPTFAIPCPPGVGNHTAGFTAAAATPEAHSATLRASKGLAFTALDLFLDPTLLRAAQSEFQTLSTGNPS